MRFAPLLAAVLLLTAAAAATAGTIHPMLQAQMDRLSDNEPVSVIVNMTEQAPVAQINAALRARNATRQERHREVISALQATRGSQDALKADLDVRLRGGGVIGYTSYWISNLMVVYATRSEIERIAQRADVDLIEPNFTISLFKPVNDITPQGEADNSPSRGIGVPPGIRAVRAPECWYELGIDGTGVLVANLDTGVDGNHPALNTRWRGYNGAEPWQECWLDVLGNNTQFPVDNYGHGTHVMGTITGLGAGTQDTVGVAWGAKWIAANAIDQGVGSGFDQDVITCLQWFADPDGNPNTVDDVPDVCQHSWRINEGFGGGYTDCDSRWWAAIDNAEAAGVVQTWSAGNEGPSANSIGSPPDRATTFYNVFSVGAVDATNYNWPYPIASFSSRGPTGCNVPNERKIKPEISAPGVDVYSSVPGGGYNGSYSGTSMAGPHVAGVVALMRQANPDLDVDTIKEIIMATARDEGTAGEDNTYGWGFIDAYAAVQAAMEGFGSIEGYVRNASWNDEPIAGARVTLRQLNRSFTTDGNGYYRGSAQAGTYMAVASAAGFASDSSNVVIQENGATIRNFNLNDNAGPTITNVTQIGATPDAVGPYAISATITDPSTVASASLYYRVNGGSFAPLAMTFNSGVYSANIPGAPAGSWIDYYVSATDGTGRVGVAPMGAPANYYTFYITTIMYSTAAEDPADPNWQLGMSGDNATSGLWIREDPVGTVYNGVQCQPEDDHTAAPGVKCFVTGNGSVGGAAGDQDVDGGCTTLGSPVFDLSGVDQAFVTYWRWFGMMGLSTDDDFLVEVSSNGGTNWVNLETVPDNDNVWRRVSKDLTQVITLTDQVTFRFRACDLNSGGLIEAAIDDFSVEVFTQDPTANPGAAPIRPEPRLAQNQPNPFRADNAVTTINFRLSNPASARLDIYDTTGRLVRTLVNEPLQSGAHAIGWDGKDYLGRDVDAGVYFYQLKAGAFEQSRRMTVLR